MQTLLMIFIVAIVVIPPLAFVVAFLDGIYCLLTKREGLLAKFGYY